MIGSPLADVKVTADGCIERPVEYFLGKIEMEAPVSMINFSLVRPICAATWTSSGGPEAAMATRSWSLTILVME